MLYIESMNKWALKGGHAHRAFASSSFNMEKGITFVAVFFVALQIELRDFYAY